jgi:hypothetical protein
MEISASIEIQSNTSCDLNLGLKPTEEVLVKYENIDFQLSPMVSISNSMEVSTVKTTIDELYKTVISNYELINYISFSFDINISTGMTNELIETSLSSLSVNSNYEVYTKKITADIFAVSNVNVILKSAKKDELYKTVISNYKLVNYIPFSFNIYMSTGITNVLKETSEPSLTVDSNYKVYTKKITADIFVTSNVNAIFKTAKKTEVSSKANYLLEDYPNLIKIKIKTNIEGSLSLTYVSSSASIMVLDPELKFLTYLDDIEYFSWIRRWRRPDSFEIKINRYKKNAKYLKVNNYLVKKTGDLLRGVRIRSRKIKVNENGRCSEKLEIKGRGFGNIFNQRIALNGVNQSDGFDTIEASAETVMKYYVDVNIINPDDDKRKIPNFKIEEDKGLGKIVKYKARFQKLSDILYDISHISGLGWDIKFDLENRKFIFQILYAELKPEIKLSTNTDSVKRIKFKEKHLNSINTAVVAGQGEGADRLVVKVTEDDL